MNLSNKNLTRLVVLFLFVFAAITSCKKYLEVKPDSKLAVPTSLSDLQAILDFTNVMNLQTTPCFGEESTDDYFLLPSTYNSFSVALQKIYT